MKNIRAKFKVDRKIKDDLFVMPSSMNHFELHSVSSAGMVEFRQIAPKPPEQPKPRTKTEYVKVTDDFWLLDEDFKAGNLFSESSGRVLIEDIKHLAHMYDDGNVYRRIETEINERDEFIDKMKAIVDENKAYTIETVLGAQYDAGCRFVDKDGE